MTRTTLTAGMKQALPQTRGTYRIGPRMRDVLLILSRTGRPWPGSLRALCRVIAEERGVTWRSVAFSVKILAEMGLIEGPPYRLTQVGERYAARRFGMPAPTRTLGEMPTASRPAPAARQAIPPSVPQSAAPQRIAAPPGGWPTTATSIGPVRCPRCGNVVRMAPIPGTRLARCTVCGGETTI